MDAHETSTDRYQHIVTRGGGIYIGMMEDLVLFNSPETGSTLALHEKQLTVQAVRDTIAVSNRQFVLAR